MRPFACDAILIKDKKILLIKRSKDPGKGLWAIPGGRIEQDETAEQCLIREMKEETGLSVEPIQLLGLYSDPNRDPRAIIAAVYTVKQVGGQLKPGDDAGEVVWVSLDELPNLAFDHNKIVRDALRIFH